MTKFIALLTLFTLAAFVTLEEVDDYTHYHEAVISIEQQIIAGEYTEAVAGYEALFSQYDFVFLRDLQVAAQLAFKVGDIEKTLQFIRQGIKAGWSMDSMEANRFLWELRRKPEWKEIREVYPDLREQYKDSFDKDLKKRVRRMFTKDQTMALKAAFRFSEGSQDRYSEQKFAPHSEEQMVKAKEIIAVNGYPGERLVGNNYWMSTILSHHNSISQRYVQRDTMYHSVKPMLWEAWRRGEISPHEMAVIDDWYLSVKYDRQEPGYAILDHPLASQKEATDYLRSTVGLRSIDQHNALLDVQYKTGMLMYLEVGWVEGKILLWDE